MATIPHINQIWVVGTVDVNTATTQLGANKIVGQCPLLSFLAAATIVSASNGKIWCLC